MRVRLLGLALLIVSAGAFYWLRELATPPSLAGPPLDQVALSTIAVLTLLSGASLLLVGSSLFEPVERPHYRSRRMENFGEKDRRD